MRSTFAFEYPLATDFTMQSVQGRNTDTYADKINQFSSPMILFCSFLFYHALNLLRCSNWSISILTKNVGVAFLIPCTFISLNRSSNLADIKFFLIYFKYYEKIKIPLCKNLNLFSECSTYPGVPRWSILSAAQASRHNSLQGLDSTARRGAKVNVEGSTAVTFAGTLEMKTIC